MATTGISGKVHARRGYLSLVLFRDGQLLRRIATDLQLKDADYARRWLEAAMQTAERLNADKVSP